MINQSKHSRFFFILVIGIILFAINYQPSSAQEINPAPPSEPVKLIFIHHSVGENWLTDGYGNLGRTLGENNYFVSDTNYGWGPDSIGDATDYYNWYDWFLGPESSRYMNAVFNETEQNSSYTRSLSDPGGENQIVIFKSCFPNSDLSGDPDAPPSDGEWFTVSHAKYVYNQILAYFGTRPDKLFIAITPPPLLDSANAKNARQFSRWLVEDWLEENNYPLNNVVVWDLHNVLTHPDNHHRILNGTVEYVINNGNGTLYYDSDGDEHPNEIGSQKATSEFIPMLNMFYNRWISEAPQVQPVLLDNEVETQIEDDTETQDETPVEGNPLTNFAQGGVIDNFESGSPSGTSGWEAFWDESVPTTLSCGADSSVAQSGTSSLRIDFYIEPDSWGTCALLADQRLSLDNTNGISFDYHASDANLTFDFDAHSGSPDARSTYFYTVATTSKSMNDWEHIELTWDQIVRVDWEENPGTPVDPTQINGFAFGFGAPTDVPIGGTIWIDNIMLLKQGEIPDSEEVNAPNQETGDDASVDEESTPEESVTGTGLCPLSTAMITMVLLGAGFQIKRTKPKPEFHVKLNESS